MTYSKKSGPNSQCLIHGSHPRKYCPDIAAITAAENARIIETLKAVVTPPAPPAEPPVQ